MASTACPTPPTPLAARACGRAAISAAALGIDGVTSSPATSNSDEATRRTCPRASMRTMPLPIAHHRAVTDGRDARALELTADRDAARLQIRGGEVGRGRARRRRQEA